MNIAEKNEVFNSIIQLRKSVAELTLSISKLEGKLKEPIEYSSLKHDLEIQRINNKLLKVMSDDTEEIELYKIERRVKIIEAKIQLYEELKNITNLTEVIEKNITDKKKIEEIQASACIIC